MIVPRLTRPHRRRLPAAALAIALCCTAGGLVGITPAHALAASSTGSPRGAGGLDPSHQQTATSMLPADTADGRAAARAAAHATPARGITPNLQQLAPGDLQGIDVASYQHPNGVAINWHSVASAGIAFVYVKASESTGYANPYFAQDAEGARAAGLEVGAYHFAQPYYSAVAQADQFAAVMRTASTALPPVLDLEETGGLSPTALVAWTHAFVNRLLSDTGERAAIYTGPYFWADNMAGSTGFTGDPLWVANYTNNTAPDQFSGWAQWTLWQYNDGTFPLGNGAPPAPIPGISGAVDRDRFSGSWVQLAALATGEIGAWLETIGQPITGRALGLNAVLTYANEIRARTQSTADIAYRLLRSSGGMATSVNADYEQVLGRAADPTGSAWLVAQRNAGMTQWASLAWLAESAPFYSAAGGTPTGFVTRVYQRLLGRNPDPAGLAHFVAALTTAHQTRYQVALEIVTSGEGLVHEVNLAFELVLGRAASPGELSHYAAGFAAGATYEHLCASLYASSEYLAHRVT